MGINGQVVVTIVGPGGEKGKDLPVFENKAKSLSYSLTGGEATITVSVSACLSCSFEVLLFTFCLKIT